jgi:hypothetical protein
LPVRLHHQDVDSELFDVLIAEPDQIASKPAKSIPNANNLTARVTARNQVGGIALA